MSRMDTAELTNEVYERLADVPSHTVLSMHRIIRETVAVLVERGFIAYDEPDHEAQFGHCGVCGAPRKWGQAETPDLHQIGVMCSKDPSHEIAVEVTTFDE